MLESESEKNQDAQEFDRAANAYRAAIELWKLGSDQVHSRLTAMLTTNSIIIAVTGLAITNNTRIPAYLIEWLIAGGMMLCVVWGFFVYLGLQVENHYRKKAEEYEKMVVPQGTAVAIKTHDWKFWGYGIAAYFTISIFFSIYTTLLIIVMNRPPAP